MARFDLFENSDGSGFLLDVQADLLDALTTRVVVPLLPVAQIGAVMQQLNPVFDVEDVPHVMMTQFLAAVPVSELGAKAGTLQTDEFQGGSFSISNLGMYGVRQFDAIINPPQCAILAVGGGEQRPVVENGELSVATVMTLSLSSDHRVIDGATGVRFTTYLAKRLEDADGLIGRRRDD